MSELIRRTTTPAKSTKKAAAKEAPAKKVAPKKSPAKKVPAKKAAAKKSPAKKAPATKVRPHKKTKKSHTDSRASPEMGLPQLPAPPLDPRAVLGLTEPVTRTLLRRAWREFAARNHPDRGGDAVTFVRGQHAYEVLKHRLDTRD